MSKQNHDKEIDYKTAGRTRRIRNIFKHLKQLEKLKIGVEKRVRLAKFRRFVVPEDQDYCMYKDPSGKGIKLANYVSLKKRKYGNLQLPKYNYDNNSADQ